MSEPQRRRAHEMTMNYHEGKSAKILETNCVKLGRGPGMITWFSRGSAMFNHEGVGVKISENLITWYMDVLNFL